MNERGKFIVFEGIDGSGKSTQIKMLLKYLQGKNIPCISTCEPTNSPFGGVLRSILSGRIEADEHTIALLFAADRADHVFEKKNGILKKLEEGTFVLCDRFYLSSFAYNGGFVDDEWVIALNEPVKNKLRPDVTIFLDLPAREGMRRIARRGETERYETFERQEKIRERYLALFERFSDENVRIVESEKDKELTQAKIRKIIDGIL